MKISLRRQLSLASRGAVNYFLKRPFCVSFEVTYSCNAHCKHCHLGGAIKNEKRAAPEIFGQLSRRLKPVVAQVSGGEPLLRRDLEQIIEAIKRPQAAPYIVVTTNGALLTYKRYNSLRRAGVDEFSLSLDYPDQRHDQFRGIPGLFNKIADLMEALAAEEDKAITLSCVVQSDNFRDLVKLVELARRWGVKMNFSTYTWLRTDNKNYLIPREELAEFKEVINQLLIFKKEYGTVYTSEFVFKKMIEFFEKQSLPNCRAGERFFVVNPDGGLSPCGLIIKRYKTPQEMKKQFRKSNNCSFCYTSIRANSEKPAKHLIKDSLKSL